MKRACLIILGILLSISLTACFNSGPKVGDRQDGLVYGKWMDGSYRWMTEDDYNRFFSEEARARGKKKLDETNRKFEEMKHRMKVSEDAERILNKH